MTETTLNNIYENNPAVKTVIDTLESNGYDAFIVGGAVRDILLNTPVNDVDIATNALPQEVEQLFPHTIPTGINFGTVTVITDGDKIEVTTFRNDGKYSDGRRPDDVTYSKTIEGDLARRDFTINAMAYNPSLGLIDPYNGLDDLFNGVIRAVGNPYDRFTEDYLRMLRAIRFSMVYDFKIEKETREAMDYVLIARREEFAAIPGPRVGKELIKMLGSGHFSELWTPYRGFLAAGIPELYSMMNYNQHNHHHKMTLWAHTSELLMYVENTILKNISDRDIALAFMFAAMFHDIGKPATQTEDAKGEWHFYGHADMSANIAKEIMQRLSIPKHITDMTYCIIKLHMYPLTPDYKSVLKIMNKVSDNYYGVIEDILPTLFLFQLYDKCATSVNIFDRLWEHLPVPTNDTRKLISIYHDCASKNIPYSIETLPIGGEKLMEATGRKPGPWIGKTLQVVLKHVINCSIYGDKESILNDAIKMSSNFKE